MYLNLDKISPDRIAIVDDSKETITYGQLVKKIKEIAKEFDRDKLVFHLVSNDNNSLLTHLSMVENGVRSLILSESIDSELLNTLISTYQPNIIVSSKNYKAEFEFNDVENKDENSIYHVSDYLHNLNDKLEFLMSTSGSTGSPKLVRYKKGNLESNAKNVAITFGWDENEVSLCSLPLNYTMGLNVINSQLVVGAQVVLTNENVVSANHWNLVEEYGVTNTCGVPFTFEVMHKYRLLNKEFPTLKTLCQGGGKMTPQLFKSISEYCKKFGKRFIASFGTTETSARMMMLPPELTTEKNLSIGKPINNGKAYLIDTDNNVISEPNVQGELVYEGPNVTLGYATKAEELALDDEFKGTYKTGDIAYFDEDGFYYIVGRIKRFIKLNSNRVGLDEIENIIKSHFNIDVAATGKDDLLVIYITDESIKSEVANYLIQKIKLSKLFLSIRVIDEIPRNDSGKILYSKLEV